MIDLILGNVRQLGLLIGAAFAVDVVFRLIPTRKTISLLGLLSRGLAYVARFIAWVNKKLPENRRLK